MIPEVYTKVSFKNRFASIFYNVNTNEKIFENLFSKKNYDLPKSYQSGRVALNFLLKNLKTNKPKRKYVITQAYGCPTVISSIINAGLEPLIIDTKKNDWDFDEREFNLTINKYKNEILTIIYMGLLGDERTSLKKKYNKIINIYDLSQSFPINNKKIDTDICDAIIYSFGPGKPFPLMNGGVFITSKKLILNNMNTKKASVLKNIYIYVKILSYPILLSYYFWRNFRKILILFHNKNVNKKNIIENYVSEEIALISKKFAILSYNEMLLQSKKSKILYSNFLEELKKNKIKNIKPILDPKNFNGTRAGFICKNNQHAENLIIMAKKIGISITNMYGFTLDEKSTNAKTLSRSIITVPMHSKMKLSNYKDLIHLFKNT